MEFAEPDYVAQVMAVPNDPLYAQQWALPKVGAPAAWDVTTGDAAVPIAIIDSGIDLTHQEFAGRLWTNPGEVAGNGLDDDGNGKVDDVHGWDFVAASGALTDDNGHGTQVAGVIGAKANNGAGIAGVCWRCPLLPITVMREAGVVNYSDIALGVAYAIERGARVINLSLGGYADATTLRTAIASAATTAVLVAGAGNDGGTEPLYPAAYPEVLAVAATDSADARTSFANHGEWVDFAAPGVEIQTTFAGANGYGAESGTSLSSALVAGTAGLVVSAHPDWSPAQVRAQLLHTAQSLGAEGLGSGRLRAGAALTTAPQPHMTVTGWSVDGGAGARPAPGQTFDLVLTLENAWLPARDVAATLLESDPYVTILDAQGAFGSLETGQSAANAANPFRVTLAANTPYNHPILFTVRLAGANGYALDVPFTLTVRSGVETIPGGSVFETDTAWTSDKTYVLAGNASVAAGATLTIEPGTHISAAPGVWLRIDGTLIADGTAEDPITFTTTSEAGEKWAGLRFSDSAVAAAFDGEGNYTGGSLLRHVEVSYAETGAGCTSRAPFISHSVFDRNSIGVTTTYAPIRIDACTFSHNTDGAILQGTAGVVNSAFEHNVMNGLSVTCHGGEALVVSANRFYANGAGAHLVGSCAMAVTGNHVSHNGGGESTPTPFAEGLHMDLNLSGASAQMLIANNTMHANSGVGLGLTFCDPDGGGNVSIANNNLLNNSEYDFASGADVVLGANYWGDIPSYQIASRIYDCNDTEQGCGSPDVGRVTRSGDLIDPDQTAPAFVRSVSASPDTVGLERATVEVTFSRPMRSEAPLTLTFHDVRRGLMERIGAVPCHVSSVVRDTSGRLWVGCREVGGLYRFDGQEWAHFTTTNSALGGDGVEALYVDSAGDIWVGHSGSSPWASRLSGDTWTTYTQESTAEALSTTVNAFAEDSAGNLWIATWNGLSRYDGSHWQRVSDPFGLTSNGALGIVCDGRGQLWVRCPDGLIAYDGSQWQAHNRSSGLPADQVSALFTDSLGRVWLSFGWNEEPATYVGMHDGSSWHYFGSANTGGVLTNSCGGFAEDVHGRIWATVNYGLLVFDGAQWSSAGPVPESSFHSIAFDSRQNLWGPEGVDSYLHVLWHGLDYPIVDNAGGSPPTATAPRLTSRPRYPAAPTSSPLPMPWAPTAWPSPPTRCRRLPSTTLAP